jgi:hypothetical protein
LFYGNSGTKFPKFMTPGQTLRNDERIVTECVEKFLQHIGLFGVLRHPIHFSLQLLSGKGLSPVIL